MRCQHCHFINCEDDHRCLKCGRILQGSVVAAPASYAGTAVIISPPQTQLVARQEGRVAPPMRRVTAAALDLSMVILGFGTFGATAWIGGSEFGSGEALWLMTLAVLTLLSLFYGSLWALARRETAGMHWTQLRLISFDGSPLGDHNRAIRFASVWLSYCSGGLGLLWALADEENLAFHDHISETYPTASATQRR